MLILESSDGGSPRDHTQVHLPPGKGEPAHLKYVEGEDDGAGDIS